MSRNKMKEEYYRSFTVADPRPHEKGHTEYRVSARFVSKRHPEDVKEVAVWRRFSELKKLHGELSYTHRNLFRRQEETFPHFPRAQVFGRFEETVIEERRKAAENMLTFSTNIPALYNSPQLKDFFRGGEVTRPLDPSSLPPSSSSPLPPPLIPLPRRRASDCEPVEETAGTEAPAPPQDLGSSSSQGEGLGEGLPEVAAEAYHEMEMEDTPTQEEEEEDDELSHASLNDEGPSPEGPSPEGPSPDPPCCTRAADQSQESQEEFDSLFDSMGEGHVPSPPPPPPPPPLSDNDLAMFDPCCKQDQVTSPNDHSELFSLPLANQDTGEAGYLTEAANELTAAIEREREGEFHTAILRYRTAVDILITGVKGDSDPGRRELVKRRTAQYLKHAEMLVDTHASPTHTHAHTQQQHP